MKRKISITTGTRAEYGILRPVLHAIDSSKKLELCLIVTGMHLSKKYGLTINEIRKDGFKIAAIVNMKSKDDSAYEITRTLGKTITSFSEVFKNIKPDLNVILGDRDEMLASAITAYHMNIPNAHIHGGDKSGGIDEYTRHAITKTSNIHFVATQKSKERVIKMGENPKFVYLVGSPSIDEVIRNKITSKVELEKKYDMKIHGDEILLLQHPVTTQIQLSKKQILNTLKAITQVKKQTIVIAPNSDAGSKQIYEQITKFSKKYSYIKMYPTVPRSDYLSMLKHFGVLVGNSSSGIIEASYFGTPVVNIGIRQKNREKSKNVIDVPQKSKLIYLAITKALATKNRYNSRSIYGSGVAATKIVKLLEQVKISNRLLQKELTY